ncbi:hypothetical protein BaRGS_00036012 [Batillaria attramentaria]|uniref:Uncharacterized protein n=1 Tax=Batillaria attramentaria TaxID=370345 RepID=A0ABD0JCU2_9CAEN
MANKEGGDVDMLKCGVCLERYRRPKLLPCFHTYCQRCVEKLAGTKPSFSCPACRTVVVIPPGGAANLQVNFYIEKDLAKQETVEGRECQLCSKGTQAKFKCVQCQQVYCSPCRGTHDSIESCTDHTILPLDGDGGGEKQGAEGAVNETKCPKHKNQMRLLFCCRCETSICIQCKLTSHDGHETEDVVDAGTKAKAQLKEESDLLDQRKQLLEAVLAKTDDFCDDLEKEKQAAEKEIRERACQLQDMVSQAQEEALRGVQSTAEMAVADIKEQANPVKETHAAIMAKRSHINQVIEEGNADEAVGLLAKLRAESDGGKKWQGQDKPVIQRDTLTVEHRPRAVRNTDIMSFIGRAKEGPLLETKAVSLGVLYQQEPVKRRLKQPSQTQFALNKMVDQGALPFEEIVYSNNPTSTFQKMCLTADGGLWLVYNPGGNVNLMSFFDREGQRLETLYENFPAAYPLIACDGDAVFSLANGMWARPGGEKGTQAMPQGNRSGSTISKSSVPCLMWPNPNNHRNILRISSVAQMPPEIDNNVVCTYTANGTYNFDVSADGKFYAFCTNPVSIFDKLESTTNLRSFASYNNPNVTGPTDVCFCMMDGREVLLVAFHSYNTVHVVDHRDAGCFIRTLESDGCKLDRPMQLETNNQGRVWVGCYGGKVVVFDL